MYVCIQVVGGRYSPFLKEDRRKELARTVGDVLSLYVSNKRNNSNDNSDKKNSNSMYELIIPWSGSMGKVSNALLNSKLTSHIYTNTCIRILIHV